MLTLLAYERVDYKQIQRKGARIISNLTGRLYKAKAAFEVAAAADGKDFREAQVVRGEAEDAHGKLLASQMERRKLRRGY